MHNKIGSVKMADSTVILDLSEVDTKDSYSVVSSLNDGSNYVAYGYDKSKSDNTYRFVIITKGTSSVFNSETQLAIFNGSEVVDDDGDKTAYNLVVNGEEKQFILDDDVVITGNAGKTVAEDAFDEGDVLVYATNSEGYISRIYSVFAAQNVLNGSSFEDFRTNAFKKQSSVLADTKFADLLSDDDNDVNVVFGPVVDKSGSNITIGTVTTNADGKYVVNYDEGLEVNYSNAKIYTYDFAARSDNSRVLLDEGIASTPDVKAAKTTDLKKVQLLKKGFQQLSSKQRNAIYFRFVQEFSWDELADMFEMSSHSCMNLVGRSVAKLRQIVLAGGQFH